MHRVVHSTSVVATTPNLSSGDVFVVTANTTALTVNAPANPPSGTTATGTGTNVLTIIVVNGSAGALLTTWNPAYVFGDAWIDPSPGAASAVSFVWDSASSVWRQVGAATPGLAPTVADGLLWTALGHSYLADDGPNSTSPGARYIDLLAHRFKAAWVANYAVSGAWSVDVAERAINTAPFAPGSSGVVVCDLTQNDMNNNGLNATALNGYTQSLRALLHILSAGSRVEETSGTWSYPVGAWAVLSGFPYSGSSAKSCGDAGANARITITATDIVLLLWGDATGIGNPGQADIKVDGSLVTHIDFSNQGIASPTSGLIPVAVHLSMGAGAHTIDIIKTDAPTSKVVVDCYLVPSAAPPTILVMKQPILAVYTSGSDAAVAAYNAQIDAVVAEFDAHVQAVDYSPGWDKATMLNASHPNDRGSTQITNAVIALVSPLPYRLGLNKGV